MTQTSPDKFLEDFTEFEKSLNGSSAMPFHQLRREAFARFTTLGFPTPKNEEWKYTNVAPISAVSYRRRDRKVTITRSSIASLLLETLGGHRLVFVNGIVDDELSNAKDLPPGVVLSSIVAAEKENERQYLVNHLGRYASFQDQSFVALNTAFLRDGAFIVIKKGTIVKEPIHLLFLTVAEGSETASYPRVLIVAEDGSEGTVIESYAGVGSEQYFTNAVTEIRAGERSVIDHYRIQTEALKSYHIGRIEAHLSRGGNFKTNSFSFGGALVRNDVHILLEGEGIEGALHGLSVPTGSQHIDNHTVIDHAKPHCFSREVYKGIYADTSTGVFNGTIIVRPDAQKTNALQSNNSLLLSERASVNSKPQLKIWADDVKCTHGATVGQLDDDALFYIRSRGVKIEDAKKMLVHGFASEVIKEIKVPVLRQHCEALLMDKLGV